ncbi:protein kinase domain-containing protein [Archangium sp.]|uniref:serine/threonine-protein kinase n=1 Tax=Archangium sp. TaxID=1872627 RepID=UPI00286AFB99|nr:protein kinase [Archangium sp.]
MDVIESSSTPLTHVPLPVQTFGPYQVLDVIGSGGMGVVYLGRHQETGETVALKTVRVPDESMLGSIRREIQALSRIRHPGVVRVFAHGISEGRPWYAMEFVEGFTLGQLIDKHWGMEARPHRSHRWSLTTQELESGALPDWYRREARGPPSSRLLRLLRRLCTPLAFLHGAGLVHRDLKPSNVFVRADGSVVLGDFGVATESGGSLGREVLQVDADQSGTALYMAPEQIRGDFVDARADLYSLGCILYECVTGFPPFTGRSTRDVLEAHLHEPPAPLSQLLDEDVVPQPLEWLILKLLEKQPQERLGYAEDVARVLTTLGVEVEEPAGLPRPQPYLYRPVFTGREDMVRKIRTAIDSLFYYQGGKIFIGGGSGVGKTRLAMEMAREALHRGIPVVTCECLPRGSAGRPSTSGVRASPLHPFRSLLAAMADRCRHLGPEETASLLGPSGKVLVAYEPSLDEIPGVRELSPPPPLPPELARARVFSALQEVLFAFAEDEPLLLIIDDLQWADELSLGFLSQLRQKDLNARGVLLLGTYRMEEMGEELREIVHATGAQHLSLGRLDDSSVRSMAGGMLALNTPPRELLEVLTHQAEGNAFFVAEYLRAAIAEGLLHRDPSGRWLLSEQTQARNALAALALPGSIAEIIHRRLGGLGTEARTLVESAAVLGREFETELLLDTASLEETAGLEAVETLRVRQILEDAARGRLRFVHDKLREVSYEQISGEHGVQLHHGAAVAIERRYSEARDFALFYPDLAHHWSKARVHAQASRYFGLAGERARVSHANGEAIFFYQASIAEARELLQEGTAAPEQWRESLCVLHESLGDMLALTGRQEESRTAYGESLARLEEQERVWRARLHRKMGKTWDTQHQHEDALRAYSEAEAALEQTPSGGPLDGMDPDSTNEWWREWVQIHVDRNWIYYWLGRVDEMAALVERIRPVVERYGAPQQRAQYFQSLLSMHLRRERYLLSAQTVEYARRSLEASRETGDSSQVVWADFCLAFALQFHGDLDESEQRSLEGLALAEQLGDLTTQSRLLTYLTLLYRTRGQVDETRRYAERSLEVALAARMEDYVGTARANLAWVDWKEQRPTEAEQGARTALALWQKLSFPYPLKGRALWLLMTLELPRGELEQAVEHAQAILDPLQQRLPDPLEAALQEALRDWSQGRREQTREHLERALALAAREGLL